MSFSVAPMFSIFLENMKLFVKRFAKIFNLNSMEDWNMKRGQFERFVFLELLIRMVYFQREKKVSSRQDW